MALSPNKIVALVIVLCAAGAFAYTLLHSAVYVANEDEVDSGVTPVTSGAVLGNAATSSSASGVPARLRIPKIELDANVVEVGLGKTGNMAVPLTYTDAGWYRFGTKPGSLGSAVIDGHVDNGLGSGAVFARLGELSVGDDIYIDTAEGNTLHFKVEDAQTYAVADVPRQTLFNRSDAAWLNLVTCDGAWIADQKMYDERRIVYTVLSP